MKQRNISVVSVHFDFYNSSRFMMIHVFKVSNPSNRIVIPCIAAPGALLVESARAIRLGHWAEESRVGGACWAENV